MKEAAVAGIANFTGNELSYTALEDASDFTLTYTSPGLLEARVDLKSDAVATKLAVIRVPADAAATNGDIVSNDVFFTQPIIGARDVAGVVDEDFEEVITASVSGPGILGGNTQIIAISGLACSFGLQSLINIFSSIGLIPTKGMTLPFVSYGGSSMISIGILFGFLLSLTNKNNE